MALILKRRKSPPTTDKAPTSSKDATEGTPERFLAAPIDESAALPPERAAATAPKKLVIKGKKPPQSAPKAPDKAVEPPEPTPIAVNKAVKLSKTAVCTFCRFERTDPCHGSKEWRGSTDKDGNKLECADKRLVLMLRAKGLDPFGKPLNEQIERDAKDDCAAGLHSWTDAKGKLHPSCECRFCGEQYGEPD